MKLLERKFKRYRQMGPGWILVSSLLALCFFNLWMPFCKLLWPSYMQLAETYQLQPYVHTNLWTTAMVQIMWWGTSLIFYFIYVGKYPLFEQWRSRGSPDEVWPWESENKETWRRMLTRSILLTLFNTLVSAQLFVLSAEYLKLYAP